MLRINILLCLLIIFSSCQRGVDGVIRTNNDVNIVFHDVSNKGSNVKKGNFINLNLSVTDLKDSLVFNSKFNGLRGVSSFLYDSSIYNSSYSDLFENLIEGDSVSFSTSLKSFLYYFLKYEDLDNQFVERNVNVHLRLISFCDKIQQEAYLKELTRSALQFEKVKLDGEKQKWDSLYDDIIVIDSVLYSRLLTKKTYNYKMNMDSINDYYVLDYTLKDLDNRVLFATQAHKPHFFQKNKQGQLLKGFELLLRKYESGDSVYAILPSHLAFYNKGAFSVMIPPFTPLKLNLRIR